MDKEGGPSRLCRCGLLLTDREHQVESNAAEKASRTRRSCTDYRQPAIPKARLRVERPIKPLSNTAGGTGSIIDTGPNKNM